MHKWLIFIGAILLLSGATTLWIWSLPDPPVAELEKARIAIAEADKSYSGKYSASLYNEAVKLYDKAMVYWKRENEKIFFNREYEQITLLAQKSQKKARLAKERSISNVATFKSRLGESIKETNHILQLFDQNFSKMPWPVALKKKEVKARLLFTEGKIAFENSDYIKSAKCIDESTEDINEVYNESKKQMKSYFSNHAKWMRQVNNAIELSRDRNCSALVVDKFAGKCYLYDSGKLTSTWDVELGKNWIGEKKMRGDKATPEGNYYITGKKAGRSTTYYKALLINYPNDEDRASFVRAKRSGQIPKSAGIGNNIEIHGGGGKGVHWTDGCVALSNGDMDKIFNRVGVGTPVTIVGSIRSFDEVFSF